MNYIIILPCYGAPYIQDETAIRSNSKDMIKILNNSVEGKAERFQNDNFHKMVIHGMFCENDKRWNLARVLMDKKDVKIYVNENGTNECCANMACLYFRREISGFSTLESIMEKPLVREKAPFFGNVALVVPVKTLMRLCPPDALKMISRTEWEHIIEDCKCEDTECEGDCDTINKFFKERGWDYQGEQVYKNVIV